MCPCTKATYDQNATINQTQIGHIVAGNRQMTTFSNRKKTEQPRIAACSFANDEITHLIYLEHI
ncbi:hypothetical protein BpHYR1_019201 [Brachionus plicatilis]|uniref:Uncharacterized protein n=1 Tax=Brachionus plicatilis TaxID=10195 RepID=A0A3M7S667_BRAPC|nr:hypothetical protein BpHYR1_019201 [Brachionus plicatilis]